MKLKVLLALAPILFILNLTDTHAQSMGVGTDSPNPNAILHLVSPGNNQGLMIPKLTTAERTAASFVNSLSSEENGLMVFDSDESAFYYWQNNQWISLKTAVNISAGSGINIANGVVTNTGDLDATNEIQDITLSGTNLSISNGSTVNLSVIDTDTRLTESEVDALVANNGFLTASDVAGYDTDASDDFDGDFNSLSNIPADLADGDQINDADADPTNELITGISLETGNILRITEGGTNNDLDLSSLTTGGSTQDLSFDGTNLNITDGTGIDISSWDTDVSDDFDGNYNSLANTPTLLSHFTNDAGYVTSADDADADISNELITSVSLEAGNILRITEAGTNNDVDLSSISVSSQNLSFDGTNLNISDGTGIDISGWDTDQTDDFDGNYGSLTGAPTNLSEFTNDAGFITSADDADASSLNELNTSGTLIGTTLRITDAGGNIDVDLSTLQDGVGTDDQAALEVSVTPASGVTSTNVQAALEELQSEIAAGGGGDMLESIYDANGDDVVDDAELVNGLTVESAVPAGAVFTDTQLTEGEVDAFVADNGYLTSEVDGSITNEIQDLQIASDILTITNNGSATPIDLSAYLDNTDTQLTEAEVDAFVADNGYLISEVDGSTSNEIQDLQLATDILTITNNGSATPIDLSAYLDNTDTQLTEAEVDAFVANNGYLSSEVDGSTTNELITSGTLLGTTLRISDAGGNTDVDLSSLQDGTGTDDQNAAEVAVTPANGVSSTNVQDALEELQGEIASAGGGDMLESVYDINGDNVVDDAELVNGLTVETAVPSGAVFTDTQLTEAEVDAFVANNGYISSEVDGSTTNEIQDLQLATNILTITNNGSATPIDLSAYLDNTDTQLTEAEVDAFVANNGYLSSEVDGSTTNEIQDLQLATDILTITNNGTATPIDLSAYLDNTDTQLTEAEVDAFVANNGYLSSEVDGSTTNELITGVTLLGTTLRISDAGGNTDVDLSSLQDGTGTDNQSLSFDGSNINISGGTGIDVSSWDTDAGDDFDGNYSSLSGAPSTLSSFTNDAGFITSPDDADASATNELIQSAILLGTTLRIRDAGANNDVDLASLVDDSDADATNELITSAGMSGDVLRINEGSNNWNVDLSQFNNDLPDQAGQSGRFLSTNGTSPSWQTVPSSPWSLNGSEVYYNSGIVGIGTSTPNASYQTTLATSMARNLWIDNNYNGSATTYGIVYSGPPSGSGTNYGHYVSGEDLNYFSGDLAIGTPNSSSKLTVLKTESAATNTLASFLEAGGSDASILFSSQSVNEFSMGVDATNSAFKISDNSELGTNDRFSIATNGSVAVGTGTPNTTYQFEVEQTTHTRGIYVDNNFSGSSNTYALYLSIGSGATGANYGIYSTGEDRNYFSGNVGMGTTAPSERLDVVGNIELNGNLISKASGTTSVNLDADGILPTPTRRVLRVRNTGSSRAEVLGIGAGEDGQELIIVNVENAYQVGTGGAPTLNDGEAYQVRFYGPSANDWGINTEDTKLLLSSYYFTMYGGSTLHLMYDATLDAWIEISRSENKESAQLN